MAHVPLTEQIEEVGREVRSRERLYPEWVKKGHYKKETAETKLAAMQAAERSLKWLAQNIDWIRPIAEQRKRQAEQQSEIEALEKHPTVEAARAVFPDVTIDSVRPLGTEPEEADELEKLEG